MIMDALKAEIVAKRKVIEEDTLHGTRPTKYMRRSDIEKLREEREQKRQEAGSQEQDIEPVQEVL
jgi:pre-mRNA-splicing factor 18